MQLQDLIYKARGIDPKIKKYYTALFNNKENKERVKMGLEPNENVAKVKKVEENKVDKKESTKEVEKEESIEDKKED